jgi:hypothetical protein
VVDAPIEDQALPGELSVEYIDTLPALAGIELSTFGHRDAGFALTRRTWRIQP